jgi:hypothetical protein
MVAPINRAERIEPPTKGSYPYWLGIDQFESETWVPRLKAALGPKFSRNRCRVFGFFMFGLTNGEIASLLKMPKGNVSRTISEIDKAFPVRKLREFIDLEIHAFAKHLSDLIASDAEVQLPPEFFVLHFVQRNSKIFTPADKIIESRITYVAFGALWHKFLPWYLSQISQRQQLEFDPADSILRYVVLDAIAVAILTGRIWFNKSFRAIE